MISHSSILCSLYIYFINCRFTVAISNCTPLGATWWETFHWGLTCVKQLTTGELTPNEALSKNVIVRYWIIWSTIWAWPNVDWTVTILSDSSFFISGHCVSWDYIYYPLFKILSLFGWMHHCTTMLCFSVGLNSFFIYKSSGTVSKLYLTMVYHLKNNGFIFYQFIIFDQFDHFFMMHQHLISNILLWIHFSSINIWEPSYKSILNISI